MGRVSQAPLSIAFEAGCPICWTMGWRRTIMARISNEGSGRMAKLRHVAFRVPDAEKAALFFEKAFDMKRVGKGGGRAIYVSDGVMNVALLPIKNPDDPVGIAHFGVWVDDFEAAEKQVLEAGATCIHGIPADHTGFYEAKYKDPDGIVFDLTHSGWPGATKEPGGL